MFEKRWWKMEISIVIPVYNSAKSIEELVQRIMMVMEEKKISFEIILVDDYSGDNSLKVIKKLKEEDSRVIILVLGKNAGQQAATKRGMEIAKGKMVVTIDDDLEQQPEDIPKLIDELKKGFDVVYGVPNRKSYPFYRKFGSGLVDSFLTLFLGKPSKVRVGSFRIVNAQILEYVVLDQTPFVYITAITLMFTKNIGNVEVSYKQRKYGKSNYNFKKLIKLFFNLFHYYRKASIN